MSAPGVVLHLLAQRPGLTGSGVTLDQLVRHAAAAGWDQHVVVGVPAVPRGPRRMGVRTRAARQPAGGSEADPRADRPTPGPEVCVGSLPRDHLHPLQFGTPQLPFPVPGMSDVMPYESMVFRTMSDEQWDRYRQAWLEHLDAVAQVVRPDLVHSHHLWLLSALVKDVFPDVPVLTHCHATGLRQLQQCPHRAREIVSGLERNDAFLVLTEPMARQVQRLLEVSPERVHVVGAGYDETTFHPRPRPGPVPAESLLYAGKLSDAKGVPQLLDAFERLVAREPAARLHMAGGGSGRQAERLRARMGSLAPAVAYHGRLDPPQLAELMRRCATFVLPSLYEGLPLVLVEAAACGCRLVATDLPVVRAGIAPGLGGRLHTVPLPPLSGVDRPDPADADGFVADLTDALEKAIVAARADPQPRSSPDLTGFTWEAVFRRVEARWLEACS